MLSSKISRELENAYINAIYKVFIRDKEIDLRIGKKSLEMDILLEEFGFDRYTFITAANPRSTLKSESENRKRNTKLENEIIQRKLIFLRGIAQSQSGNWQEKSFCILGIDLKTTKVFAEKFEQNAFLYGLKNQILEIVYCIKKSW